MGLTVPRFTSSIGGRVAAPGPGDFPQATPADFGAAIGQGLAGLGEAGGQLVAQRRRETAAEAKASAAILEKQRKRQEADDELAAGTRIATENSNAALRREDIKNSSLSGSEYIQGILKDHDDMAAAILEDFSENPAQRAFAENQLALDREALATGSTPEAAKINARMRVGGLVSIRDAGSNRLIVEPFALEGVLSAYRDGLANINMPPDDKLELLRDAEDAFAQSHIMGLAKISPELARQSLKSKGIGNLLKRESSILLGKNIDAVEKARITKAEDAADLLQIQSGNDIVSAISRLSDLESPSDPDDISVMIQNSPLDPAGTNSKVQYMNIMSGLGRGIDQDSQSRLYADLTRDIANGEILDPNEMLIHVEAGNLSIPLWRDLSAFVTNPDRELISRFERAARGSITGSHDFFVDPEGDKQFFKFQQELRSELKRLGKAGESVSQLLDPSPDNGLYIGGRLISSATRDIEARIKSKLDQIKGLSNSVSKETRRPGESDNAYFIRVFGEKTPEPEGDD